MDRGTWQAIVHGGHKELDTTERLSTHTYIHTYFLTTPHTCGFLIPPPKIEPTTPTPQHGKEVLTTGPPGKSLCAIFNIIWYVLKSIIPTFSVLKYEHGILCSVISYQTPMPIVGFIPTTCLSFRWTTLWPVVSILDSTDSERVHLPPPHQCWMASHPTAE